MRILITMLFICFVAGCGSSDSDVIPALSQPFDYAADTAWLRGRVPKELVKDPEHGARITGVVKDSVTSQPIIGAWVWLRNTRLGMETDSLGQFEFCDLPAGRFAVRAWATNYQVHEIGPITLEAGQTISLEFTLVDFNFTYGRVMKCSADTQ